MEWPSFHASDSLMSAFPLFAHKNHMLCGVFFLSCSVCLGVYYTPFFC